MSIQLSTFRSTFLHFIHTDWFFRIACVLVILFSKVSSFEPDNNIRSSVIQILVLLPWTSLSIDSELFSTYIQTLKK